MPDTHVKTILAADIGGTHSRFALFHLTTEADAPLATLHLVRRTRFVTTDSADSAHMMRLLADTPGDDGGFFLPSSPDPVQIDAAVFGIPGPAAVADITVPPPADALCHCPNIPWPLEGKPVAAALGGVHVRFINDFVANGFACAMLPDRIDAVPILPGEHRPLFPQAVIGAGTGLGHCLILPGPTPVVAGAEAGHALFPFLDDEADIRRHFAKAFGTERITGDMAVGGSALSLLYAHYTGETVHPHTVAPLAAKHPQTLERMAGFYGRAVLQYVLATLPLGGVFITGGLATHLPEVLTHPAFIAELREKNPMSRNLGDIPLLHARSNAAGLWGSAACAVLGTGVSTFS